MRIERIGTPIDLPGIRSVEWHEAAAPDGDFVRLPLPDVVLTINLGVVGTYRLRDDAAWAAFPQMAVRGVSASPSFGRDPATGRLSYLSVVIAPWAVSSYLALSPGVVAGRIEDAGALCRWLPHLATQLAAVPDAPTRLQLAMQSLRQRWDPARVSETARAVIDALREDRPVHAVAAECGISVRRVHQLCRRETGLNPSAYRQVSRFARLMQSLHRADRSAAWSDFVRGYADHSHAIRAFRRHAGTTPRAYFAGRAQAPRAYSIVPVVTGG